MREIAVGGDVEGILIDLSDKLEGAQARCSTDFCDTLRLSDPCRNCQQSKRKYERDNFSHGNRWRSYSKQPENMRLAPFMFIMKESRRGGKSASVGLKPGVRT